MTIQYLKMTEEVVGPRNLLNQNTCVWFGKYYQDIHMMHKVGANLDMVMKF